MSRESTSLEWSKLLENDDSNNDPLAKFLQDRHGLGLRRNFRLINDEPMRLSLNVEVEKLPEKKQNTENERQMHQKEDQSSAANKKTQIETSDKNDSKKKDESSVKDVKQLPNITIPENNILRKPISPVSNVRKLSPRLSVIRKSGGVSPCDRLRRYSLSNRLSKVGTLKRGLLAEFENTISESGFAPNVCSTPLTQETANDKEDTLKNNNIGKVANVTSEGLENVTVSQGEHCCGHSEIFLKSPQCNDQNLRNMVRSIVETTLKSSQSIEKENVGGSNALDNTQRREETPNSTIKKTYTLERGQIPGQVVLTPDDASPTRLTGDVRKNISISENTYSLRNSFRRSTNTIMNRSHTFTRGSKSPYSNVPNIRRALHDDEQNCDMMSNKSIELVPSSPVQSHLLSSKSFKHIEDTSNVTLKSNIQTNTPEKVTPNRSQITIRVESPRIQYSPRCSNIDRENNVKTLNKSQCNGQIISTPTHLRCQTSTHAVVSEVDIPNTQHVNISVAYAHKEDDLVIPETQETRPEQLEENSGVPIQTDRQDLKRLLESSKGIVNEMELSRTVSSTAEEQNVPHRAENVIDEAEEDNLKLTDIMTDDEDPTPKAIFELSATNNSQAPLNLAASKNNVRTKRLRKRSMSRRRLNMDHSQVMSTEAENEEPTAAHNYKIASRKRSTRKKCIPLNKAPGTPLNGEKFAMELARMSNYEILDLRKRNSMGRVFPISGRKSCFTKEEAIKKQIELDDEIEMELLRRNIETAKEKTPPNSGIEDMIDTGMYPPVPAGFRDLTEPQLELNDGVSSLIDEKSCERVSLKPRKHSLRQRTSKVPEVLQHYLEVPRRISQKKNGIILNSSKRPLYTKGQSDCEESYLSETNALETFDKQSLPFVRSPPRTQPEHMSSVRAISPPPPLSDQLRDSQSTDLESVDRLPPPLQFESDSGIDSNVANLEKNKSIHDQKDDLVHKENTVIEDVFKVPLHPPPKTRTRKKRKNGNAEIIPSGDEQSSLHSLNTTDSSENCTLRRSKRGHVPLKNSAPLFQMLFQKVLTISAKRKEQVAANNKKKARENVKKTRENSSVSNSSKAKSSRKRRMETMTETESTFLQNSEQVLAPKTKTNRKTKKDMRQKPEKENSDQIECNRIMSTPAPLDNLDNIFDQLRNTGGEMVSENESAQTVNPPMGKNFKIRIARLKNPDLLKAPSTHSNVSSSRKGEVASASSSNPITQPNSPSVSSSANPDRSNSELISWLKNFTGTENITHSGEVFNEMRISSASNLCFTELQGVEYAFYDTEDKASLGYLRFKPRQIKPKKRAKRYHLHFVALVGDFRITANDKVSLVGPGDMIAIKKSVYYDIANLSDDIGILMVVKK